MDRKILRVLQRRPDLPMTELAAQVGLSHTPCWRRIKKLEAEGVIQRRALILATLRQTDGNRTRAAGILGISVRTMRNKLGAYARDGIDVPRPGAMPADSGSVQMRLL